MLTKIKRVSSNQAMIWKAIINGKNAFKTPLSSQTVDSNDAKIARRLLKMKKAWSDENAVNQLSRKFEEWNGSNHAYCFSSGRVALSSILNSMELSTGDEVIVPGYTCVVVSNAVKFAGLIPVYCDIELDTYGGDVSSIKERISKRTKVIIIQHLYGLVARDTLAIIELARRNNILVIEDCAHSTGAIFKGIKVGNYGDAAFYSTEQSKVLSSCQGGIAVTNDEKIARGIEEYYNQCCYPSVGKIEKILRTFMFNYYFFSHKNKIWAQDYAFVRYGKSRLRSTSSEECEGRKPAGYEEKMSGPIALLVQAQLAKIESINDRRRNNALKWDEWAEKNGYRKPLVIEESTPVYLRYPVMIERANKLNTASIESDLGVQVGVWFKSNLHPSDEKVLNCPNANAAVERCINLPCL